MIPGNFLQDNLFMTPDFEMTKEGCERAKNFLTLIGKIDDFLENGQSVDGFTMVAYANVELEKLRNE